MTTYEEMNFDAECLPEYLSLSPHERGGSVNRDRETYSYLARSALAIAGHSQAPAFMGIYRLPEIKGCALDIFIEEKCLTIVINCEAQTIALYLSPDLDSPAPCCLLSASNSREDWHRLKEMAKAQLSH